MLMKKLPKSYNKTALIYMGGIFFLIASALTGIMLGSSLITSSEIWQIITGNSENSAAFRILFYVRLPRTLACIVCGAALSVSGAVIQSVLNNRLASPSIIGVNSGAGLAVTLAMACGIYSGLKVSLLAFLGAFTVSLLVSVTARKWGASRSTVILMGVALNSLLNALSDSITTFDSNIGVMSNDFRIGEFSAVTYQKLLPAAAITVIALVILSSLTNELEILTLGQDTAHSLGMNVFAMRTVFLLLASLLAGCAVSVAGLLSFVGLVVPHIVRRISGGKISHLLPLCIIYGGAFVTLCDTLARTLFSPYEVPVGIIMAFIGAPFFVFILIRGKGGHRHA